MLSSDEQGLGGGSNGTGNPPPAKPPKPEVAIIRQTTSGEATLTGGNNRTGNLTTAKPALTGVRIESNLQAAGFPWIRACLAVET